MKKLQIFESINGEEVKYGRSQTAYKLDREIIGTYKNKTGGFDWVRYSPAFKSYSTTIAGRDCNLKAIEYQNEQDKKDLEELFNIDLG